jgi:hypothetical protein
MNLRAPDYRSTRKTGAPFAGRNRLREVARRQDCGFRPDQEVTHRSGLSDRTDL